MVNKRIGPWQILILAAALSLTLIIPAAAQETVPTAIQPGEVIEVGSDPLVLDLINLRNPDTFNPITELRRYKDDNPGKKVERVIGVPNDGYFKISDQALNHYDLRGYASRKGTRAHPNKRRGQTLPPKPTPKGQRKLPLKPMTKADINQRISELAEEILKLKQEVGR